jgi:transcriptional regulator with XRE-family HTH domain
MPKTSLSVELGRLIREMRTARGYSQEGFAYRCGVHRTYETNLERGTKNPSILILAKIARGLCVEVSEIWLELERRGATVEAVTDEPVIR